LKTLTTSSCSIELASTVHCVLVVCDGVVWCNSTRISNIDRQDHLFCWQLQVFVQLRTSAV